MAKIRIYKSVRASRVLLKKEFSGSGISLGSLLREHSDSDSVVFLNNEKVERKDMKYKLRDSDILFVFEKRNN